MLLSILLVYFYDSKGKVMKQKKESRNWAFFCLFNVFIVNTKNVHDSQTHAVDTGHNSQTHAAVTGHYSQTHAVVIGHNSQTYALVTGHKNQTHAVVTGQNMQTHAEVNGYNSQTCADNSSFPHFPLGGKIQLTYL